MAPDLVEALVRWHAAETQTAVFRSLLAVEALALTFDGISEEMLDAIREPLRGVYETFRDHEDTWEEVEDD